MNVSLTPDLEHFARDLVKSGEYSSASEVMREALRLFKKSLARDEKVAELRSLIQESLESGPPVTMTSDQLREMIHEHAVRRRTEQAAVPARSKRGVVSRNAA